MTNFQRTAAWLAACGKEPRNDHQASVAIGVMLEEISELLETLRTPNDGYQLLLERTRVDLEWFAGKLKRGEQFCYIPTHKRVEALDAIADVEVTVNGVAWFHGMNKDAADQAVLASNDAKLVDGKPVILEGGKIGKPAGWRAPDLSSFV
jgi:hypothetical protein